VVEFFGLQAGIKGGTLLTFVCYCTNLYFIYSSVLWPQQSTCFGVVPPAWMSSSVHRFAMLLCENGKNLWLHLFFAA